MNTAKPTVSFDEIINRGTPRHSLAALPSQIIDGKRFTDRQRRGHEALAQEIFGKDRRSSETGKISSKRTGQTPSLASRTGIAKVYH